MTSTWQRVDPSKQPRRVSRAYLDGWHDATTAMTAELNRAVEHVQWLGISAREKRPADRTPVDVGGDVAAILLDEIHHGRLDIVDHARVLVDYDPAAAAECMVLLAYLATSTSPEPQIVA